MLKAKKPSLLPEHLFHNKAPPKEKPATKGKFDPEVYLASISLTMSHNFNAVKFWVSLLRSTGSLFCCEVEWSSKRGCKEKG